MENWVVAARRTSLTALVVLATSFALAVLAMRQPTWPHTFAGPGGADRRRLEQHVYFLTTAVLPRNVKHQGNLDASAEYIRDEFRQDGARVSEQRFVARKQLFRNVIAEFGPPDARQPLLIVGAHYDAFGDTGNLPGADDNASGTAALLEIARVLGSKRVSRPVMLVAYANEEPPFFGSEQMGSAVHASWLAESHRSVAGMICLEMIGYYTAEQPWDSWLLGLMYPRRGDFIAIAGGWADRKLTRYVKMAMSSVQGSHVVSFTARRELLDASDQRNYWSHNWTAVIVTDTAYLRNPNYHTTRDTADSLDYERMAKVVDGCVAAILQNFSSG
jgi:hypothetical protein